MDAVYEKAYTVTDMHADAFGRAKPSALLFFCQDIATDHAAQLCGSWESLQEKHLFWAVSRHALTVSRPPILGETITLKTWPMPTTRVAYPRAVEGYDSAGNRLFQLISLWVLMDTEKRTLVLPGKSGLTIDGVALGCEGPLPGSLLPGKHPNNTSRQVTYSELDRNCHMNNTRYMEWLADLLPLSFHKEQYLSKCTLCYLAEALPDQTLRLSWEFDAKSGLRMDTWRKEATAEKRIFCADAQFSPCVL